MSAPDPNKWEATDAECQMIGSRLSAAVLAETVARRRALAELKALLSETYEPYVNQHYGGPAPTLLNADVILDRIAEIEAEEA